MQERFQRTQMLLGEEAVERLRGSRVAVFGVGGVGGYAAEALARSGVGRIDLIDSDTVAESNCNRQIIALSSTIGRKKVDVMKERILDINPEAVVRTYACFILPENEGMFDFSEYDYVADAIDTVTAKLMLAEKAFKSKTPIISCMGAGNKLDPTAFEVADISETKVCPLARVMRRELKKRGIISLKVVYSKEEARKPEGGQEFPEGSSRRSIPGSVAFVPSVAGLIMGSEIIKDLIKDQPGSV